ncbi:MAG: hypothetical protein ACXW29_13995, partial [Thermoanaerobaculia bacterium]
MHQQLVVALLDLGEHAVESGHQIADLIAVIRTVLTGPHAEVLVLGDQARNARKLDDRPGNSALQSRPQNEGDEQRGEKNDDPDLAMTDHLGGFFTPVADKVDDSHDFAIEPDSMEDFGFSRAEDHTFALRRRNVRCFK